MGTWYLLAATPVSNPRKFSVQKSYFRPIRMSFVPRKFPTIRYCPVKKQSKVEQFCSYWCKAIQVSKGRLYIISVITAHLPSLSCSLLLSSSPPNSSSSNISERVTSLAASLSWQGGAWEKSGEEGKGQRYPGTDKGNVD